MRVIVRRIQFRSATNSKLDNTYSRLIPVPQKLIEFLARLFGKPQLARQLCNNLQVDITKARQLLNWQPPFTVDEGLKRTVSGFTKRDDCKSLV